MVIGAFRSLLWLLVIGGYRSSLFRTTCCFLMGLLGEGNDKYTVMTSTKDTNDGSEN